jgi:hypothetical protein
LAFAVLFLALLCASAPKTARAQQEAGEVVPIYDTSTFDYHHHVATRHNGVAWTERDASVDSPVAVAVAFDPSWVRTAGPDGGAHGVYKALGPDATGNRTREPTLLTSADPQQWALALASVQVPPPHPHLWLLLLRGVPVNPPLPPRHNLTCSRPWGDVV